MPSAGYCDIVEQRRLSSLIMTNGSNQEFSSRVKPQPQDQEEEQAAVLPNTGEDFPGFSRTGELPGTISLSFVWLILIAALSFIAGLIAANGFGH